MWQTCGMVGQAGPIVLHRTLIEGLTIDAMVLADEIETYFGGEELQLALTDMSPQRQALFARVGLKMAGRLNRLVEWLVRRDVRAEILPDEVAIGEPICATDECCHLTPPARALAEATTLLFARMEQLHDPENAVAAVSSPARALQARLARRLTGSRD